MVSESEPVEELTEDECWALLGQERLGRIAFQIVGELHVLPLNYAVVDHALFMRSTAGNKMFAAALGSEVALEIDGHDDREAWSVIVHGRLRILDEDDQHRLDGTLPEPWVATFTYDVLELRPMAVTGRRFLLR